MIALTGEPCEDELVVQPVYWAPILDHLEDELEERLAPYRLAWQNTRSFIISYLGDAIAYQPIPGERGPEETLIYKQIHEQFEHCLTRLARMAGDKAPLCVISHSLGSVIASNFFHDKQIFRTSSFRSPMERGETLAFFYTLGSPIAIWGLRYKNFGDPLAVPAPQLKKHHPFIQGEWLNFFNKFDVLSYPIQSINDRYCRAVTGDVQVNVGHGLFGLTPAAHLYYWTNRRVLGRIAEALARATIALREEEGLPPVKKKKTWYSFYKRWF
ncbi:hypothetical protein J31TS4_21190 [Paenibacillus sp. J31TS4]|uniref:chemotaxis protein n=1 Tax=Paenibacillus sp. J31TS4 TaxID=2807195 RepID=UPI001B1BACEA|nr:chemotaxis protein [Paenibacillus sp. J31TS4]GIP38839.1 hypothetical protein J31TS4_21190 [Paenibacillus sp. J31TS4]